MSKLELKLIELTHALRDRRKGEQIHTSFIVKRNTILSIGINSNKTHPTAAKFGYPYQTTHSELSALVKMDTLRGLDKYVMYNVRLGKLGNVLLSKPCKNCQRMLTYFGLKHIMYSTESSFKSLRNT